MCSSIISMASGAVSSGISAYGSYQSGKFQKKMAEYQANLNVQRASIAEQQGRMDSMAAAERARQLVAAGRVAGAGSGRMLDPGVVGDGLALWEVDVQEASAMERENIASNSQLASWGFMTNSEMNKAQGRYARFAGNLGAAGNILSGTAQTASYGSQMISNSGSGSGWGLQN